MTIKIPKQCRIRSDILSKGDRVPVKMGKIWRWISGDEPFEYGWFDNDTRFQIKFDGLWCDAYPKDFDFLN